MSFPHTEKLSEKEKPESTSYTCHRYNARNESVLDALKTRFYHLPYYITVSIDPAINNLGFYIERRYNNDYVQTLYMEKAKFKACTDPNSCSSLYLEVMEFLDKHSKYYTECHLVIIERQFKYQSARVMQQVISYFMSIARTLVNQPFIIEIDSKVRLKQLKCPAGLNRSYQKKWVVEKAYHIFRQRGDQQSIAFLDAMKTKKDDVCDAVLQVEAFCILTGLLPPTRDTCSISSYSSQSSSPYPAISTYPSPSSYSNMQGNSNGNFVLCMDDEDEITHFK